MAERAWRVFGTRPDASVSHAIAAPPDPNCESGTSILLPVGVSLECAVLGRGRWGAARTRRGRAGGLQGAGRLRGAGLPSEGLLAAPGAGRVPTGAIDRLPRNLCVALGTTAPPQQKLRSGGWELTLRRSRYRRLWGATDLTVEPVRKARVHMGPSHPGHYGGSVRKLSGLLRIPPVL
jgi:hypothetical protein